MLNEDGSVAWLRPTLNPHEWSQAVTAGRSLAIEAARLRRCIIYGALRIAAYEVTGMKVDYRMYARLTAAVNEDSNSCLLSSIIVSAETDEPGDGFLDFARERGFDAPLKTLQRRVFEHFSPPA